MIRDFSKPIRQTKIVATLGPSSSSPEMIHALFDAGVDVFRLNFSHGSAQDHRERMQIVRKVEADLDRPIGVLADLQGPKLRLGGFKENAAEIHKGQRFRLDLDPALGDATRAPLPHPEIFAALKKDTALLLDDGKVRLRVLECGPDFAITEVEAGTKVSNGKGVNVPDVVLPLSSMTAKDKQDLETALELGADWIALSFVQRAQDVEALRALVNGRAAIMAKLEKPAAIDDLANIIACADGVMVARGDLGVEMPIEDVPHVQRRIVREARRAGKPVIVATQMLESMITAPMPTRAEVSDVATAVYEGADAVMLSAETASGTYPIEAVAVMARIARQTHADMLDNKNIPNDHPRLLETGADAITAAARQVAETIKAVAIMTYSTSGSTTLRAARERPHVPIIGMTPNVAIARRLALSFGVRPVLTPDVKSFSEMIGKAQDIALERGVAHKGERVVITAGIPFGTPGKTNLLHIATIARETGLPV